MASGARVGAALGIGRTTSFGGFGDAEAEGDGEGDGEGEFCEGGDAATDERQIKKISPMRPERNFMALLLRHPDNPG